MKKIVFILLLAGSFQVTSQNSFDKSLKTLADSISLNIAKKGKVKIAVWHFVNFKNKRTALSNYVADDLSVHLVNNNQSFYVMDRFHLDQILNEHQLKSDNYIDPESAKELGRILAVDYIVTGNVHVIGEIVKVRVKVLDTETAHTIVASQMQLPIDKNIASYIGIRLKKEKKPEEKILKPFKGKAPDLEPIKVYRSKTGGLGNIRPAGADPNDFYKQVNRNSSSSKKSENSIVLAGTELLKFLNNSKSSKKKGIIKKFVVSKKHSKSGVSINTAYYSKKTNSVYAYIKSKEKITKYEFRVSILNKKDIEVVNTFGRITLNPGEAHLYQFKFDYNFELFNKMKINFE